MVNIEELKEIEISAFGIKTTVDELLTHLSKEQVSEIFSQVTEDLLMEGEL